MLSLYDVECCLQDHTYYSWTLVYQQFLMSMYVFILPIRRCQRPRHINKECHPSNAKSSQTVKYDQVPLRIQVPKCPAPSFYFSHKTTAKTPLGSRFKAKQRISAFLLEQKFFSFLSNTHNLNGSIWGKSKIKWKYCNHVIIERRSGLKVLR